MHSNSKRYPVWITLFIIMGALIGLVTRVDITRAQETGPNLLTNGDFEQGAGEAWPFQDGIVEVQVAPGWRAFWTDEPPPGTAIPSYCEADDYGCYWGRPEFRGVDKAEFAYRVHGGRLSQKYFSWNRQHEAGLYQKVDGIEPGSRLRFQIHMQTWSCLGASDNPLNCPTAPNSNNPAPMHTKVGIDPTGGVNPWAPTVVWSGEFETYDTWTPFWVEATAEATSVTVFTYSRADWTNSWPRINNDVYLDDASLVVVGETTPTAPPPPPTSEVPPTPRATSTPLPNGAVVHVVESGDTLFGIALQYNVPVDQLRQLNAGSLGPNDMLRIGQELVISGEPMELPTPTPAANVTPETQPTPPPEEEAQTPGTNTETPQLASDEAAVCVAAFLDQDGDQVYQPGSESLVPGVTINLVGTDGPAGTHMTTGLDEPHCFSPLNPGNYVLRHSAPEGYAAAGAKEQGILLTGGKAYTVHLTYVMDNSAQSSAGGQTGEPNPTAADPTATSADEEETSNSTTSILNKVIRISGIAAVVLTIAVAVLFVISRRGL
jgi:LysM repeat protein